MTTRKKTMNPENLIASIAKLKIKNQNRLNKIKRAWANENKTTIPTNAEILELYRTLLKQKEI
ncbi:MAG: hypothetical protein WCT18_01995, partial [Patescibacteria group bacterium]